MAHDEWDVTVPINHTKISDVPAAIRDLRSSTKIIVAKEHVMPATDNAGGQHVKGSCRVYLQSGLPTKDPEGDDLATGAKTSDNGRLACLTGQSNALAVYVATGAGVATGWQPVAARLVYLSDTMRVNGNAIIGLSAGTQGNSPVALGQVDTGFFNIVEPTTNAVIQVKVVGTYLAASGHEGLVVLKAKDSETFDGYSRGAMFSGWYMNDSSDNPLAVNNVYKASQDCFVTVRVGDGNDYLLTAYEGATSSPTTVVGIHRSVAGSLGGDGLAGSLFFAVAKNHYFKVTCTVALAGYLWMGIGGNLGPEKQ